MAEHKVKETMSYDPEEFLALHKGDITIKELAEHLTDCVALYGEEATIHWHQEWDNSQIEVSWERDETKQERKLREREEAVKEQRAQVAREKQRAKELKLLHDLKEKYEKTGTD